MSMRFSLDMPFIVLTQICRLNMLLPEKSLNKASEFDKDATRAKYRG